MTLKFHIMRAAKALARLHKRAGSTQMRRIVLASASSPCDKSGSRSLTTLYMIRVLAMKSGRIAQVVTCLAADASLPADPGVASSILAPSNTFVEIDHEIISTVILLPQDKCTIRQIETLTGCPLCREVNSCIKSYRPCSFKQADKTTSDNSSTGVP